MIFMQVVQQRRLALFKENQGHIMGIQKS